MKVTANIGGIGRRMLRRTTQRIEVLVRERAVERAWRRRIADEQARDGRVARPRDRNEAEQ